MVVVVRGSEGGGGRGGQPGRSCRLAAATALATVLAAAAAAAALAAAPHSGQAAGLQALTSPAADVSWQPGLCSPLRSQRPRKMLLSVPPRAGINPYNGYNNRTSKKVTASDIFYSLYFSLVGGHRTLSDAAVL